MPATSGSQVQRLPPLQCHPEGLSPELCDLAGYWEETPATEVTFHRSSQSLRGSEGNEIDREFLWESSRGPLRKGTCLEERTAELLLDPGNLVPSLPSSRPQAHCLPIPCKIESTR